MVLSFFWVVFFIIAFLGAIALVFYLTIELNELEKNIGGMSEEIAKRYGLPDDFEKRMHAYEKQQ